MQNAGGGLDLDGGVGNDAAVMPALTLVPVHDEHVVGEVLGKAQLALIGGPGLGVCGTGYGKIVVHGGGSPFSYFKIEMYVGINSAFP